MKIVKADKELQLKLSFNEWLGLGVKAGWLKQSNKNEQMEVLSKDEEDGEKKETEKEGFTYEGKHYKVNPFAVCTKTVGRDNKDKYERCVLDVKKKSKE